MIKKQKNSFRLESPEPSFVLFCYLNIGDNSHLILAESNRVEKSYSCVYQKMLFFFVRFMISKSILSVDGQILF